ncbi:CBS domain-containing protein [Rheinheimera sp. MMS21-TC3]|uniref:CBS domain-containing protein n=1 Tax=Rheinheimera sp. MMS21-TC3 TaxID=3072790 RepID=UPI0028C4A26A|nr:CBS domain-containing protein [Rheinheimera sp. MMS21-TC3]WNO60298.1 CBS domain-containing protein [Rheinheimera sp. MMS21-TC3]
MKKLPLYTLESIDHLVQPADFAGTAMTSPALNVLVDFKHNQPNTILASTSAADALALMQQEQTKIKLVVDNNDILTGLIDVDLLSDQAIMRHVANGQNRLDIKVTDLMRPRDRIKGIAYQQLKNCTIADVINTLQSSGEQYCLVVDRENHQIRGIISAQDIARRLRIPLTIQQAPTFLHIFDSLSLGN